MQEPVTIVLLGRPVPGNQPHKTASGFRFLPKRQADALAQLRVAASEAMRDRPMLEGALMLEMAAEMPIPTTWSKKKQQAALRGDLWPIVKPDLKNLLWLAEDALSTVVFADDNAVCVHATGKRYGAQPKLTIVVSAL